MYIYTHGCTFIPSDFATRRVSGMYHTKINLESFQNKSVPVTTRTCNMPIHKRHIQGSAESGLRPIYPHQLVPHNIPPWVEVIEK